MTYGNFAKHRPSVTI